MADEENDQIHDTDEFRALAEVRAALEAVERQQGDVARERRGLRAQLEGLLGALREDALILLFDTESELVGAHGPVEEQLAVTAAELVAGLEELADEETLEALDEANRAVLDESSPGAIVSDGFLHGAEDELAVTWVHIQRTGDDGKVAGTEAIGLVAPALDLDDDLGDAADPFDTMLEHMSRRLLDDAGEASIARAVQNFGDFLLADRVVVNRYDEEARKFSVASSWLRGGTRPLDAETRGISISELPWAYSALGAGEAVVISDEADLPDDARAEKVVYAGDNAKSSLLVPMLRHDALTGFVSIQSAHSERAWEEADVARAIKFVMLLASTLARGEAEAEALQSRDQTEEAQATAAQADTRVEEAEARESEAREKLEGAVAGADELRDQLSRHRAEAEEAREASGEAREAAEATKRASESARQEAEEARQQLAELRQEAEDARNQLSSVQEEGERAQRRSEEAAADALAVRNELGDVRGQLDEALREAAELRAGGMASAAAGAVSSVVSDVDTAVEAEVDGWRADLAGADDVEPEIEVDTVDGAESEEDTEAAPDDAMELEAETGSTAFGALEAVTEAGADREMDEEFETEMDAEAEEEADETSVPAFDPDATVEMKADGIGRAAFDPDATLEIEPAKLAAAEAAAAEDIEPPGDDLPRAVGLDALIQHAQTTPEDDAAPSKWKEDKATWEDRTGEVDLPAFLEPASAGAAEEEAESEGETDDDVEFGDDGVAELGDDLEPGAAGDVESDVEAARQLARQVAGKDESGDDFEEMGGHDTQPPPVVLPESVERTGELDAHHAEAPPAAASRLANIDERVGLEEVGGNVELYHTLLNKFRNDYIGAAAKIDSAIEKGNIEVAHLLLHAVKGVAGVLGAVHVRETADELETRLIGNDPAATHAAVGTFTAALDEVLESIAHMGEAAALEPEAPAGAVEVPAPRAAEPEQHAAAVPEAHVSDPMVLRSYLSGLRQHLLAEKPRQCQLVMREITARNWPGDYNERVARLAEFVEADDFERARETFDELMEQFAA